ncbi:MAG: class I SAM-dependent methyltransferase [Alphaproteobacteria bacterium]|nr:class I SAM-dependent methyltransferase [Alphaproteobacteria bacterium]
MTVMPILKGLATFVLPPSLHTRQVGGTESARYCYSVYLRHLCRVAAHAGDPAPARVAELGPGASIGIGLAALIAGADRYDGLDIKSYPVTEPTRRVFEELVALFAARTPIPDEAEFPEVKPKLDSYAFPDAILTGPRLDRALAPDRLDRIRRALNGDQPADAPIVRYVAPWTDAALVESGSVDWIFSQAVMEHVDDLAGSYACCSRWLRPGGAMSHQIDFRCHGTAAAWNGHWARSDLAWRAIRGARPYLLNRQPYSAHRALIEQSGFAVTFEQPVTRDDGIDRSRLAPGFRRLSDDDLCTSGAFLVAVKPDGGAD